MVKENQGNIQTQGTVLAYIAPHPFKLENHKVYVKEGATLADILSGYGIDDFLKKQTYIFIDDHLIPPENWHKVRPKHTATVDIRVRPMGGGGGKNPLRTVLTIAIIAAGAAFGPALGSFIFNGAGFIGPPTLVQVTVGKAIIGAVGFLALNALVPPPSQKLGNLGGTDRRDSPTLFIQGARNRLTPFGRIPQVLGRHRMFPPLGATQFTETVGDDQFLRAIFVWGWGPVVIEDLKIGETSISQFQGVEIETDEGFDANTAPTFSIFPDSVAQEILNITLTNAVGFQTRTTGLDVDEIEVDVTFPQGLVEFDPQGKRQSRSVSLEVQYSLAGQNDWSVGFDSRSISAQSLTFDLPPTGTVRKDLIVLDKASGVASVIKGSLENPILGNPVTRPPLPGTKYAIAEVSHDDSQVLTSLTDLRDLTLVDDGVWGATSDFLPVIDSSGTQVDVGAGTLVFEGIQVTGKQTNALRRAVRFQVDRGQYDVRIRRETADVPEDEGSIFDTTVWTALRGFTNESPIKLKGIAATAVRIKATDQLNGTIDQLNAIVTPVVKDWDTGTQTWIERPSNNPASLYRHVLQGRANARPIDDSRINLTALQEWHEDNVTEGREFNMVRDFQGTVFEALADIASAGRATPAVVDGQWTVVRDKPQTTPVQHFSPRNSFDFRAEKAFADIPHAFRVQFVNDEKGFIRDERLVFDDGFNENNATRFETMEVTGITDPNQVWKEARYHIAVARLRPEIFEFSADMEHLVATRGDLIRFTHDVPLFGLESARVLSVVEDSSQQTSVTLDADVTMEAGTNYSVRFRLSDGASTVAQVVTNAGTTATLTYQTPITLANAPSPGDLALFGVTGTESVELVIRTVVPQRDLTARIKCIAAAPGVHTADTGTIPAFNSQITVPPEMRAPVAPMLSSIQSGEEVLVRNPDGTFQTRIVIALTNNNSRRVIPKVIVKPKDQTFFTQPDIVIDNPERISITNIDQGEIVDIEIRYQAENTNLLSEALIIPDHLVSGTLNPPADVANFNIQVQGDTATLTWDEVVAPDLLRYELRFAPVTSGATWGSSVPVIANINRSATNVTVPAAVGTYLIKAIDRGNRASVNATSIVTNISALENLNVVTTITESPSFAGVKTNLTVDASNNLILLGAGNFDNVANVDQIDNFDIGDEGLAASGTYDFSNVIDLGQVFTSKVTPSFTAFAEDLTFLIDNIDNFDNIENVDGSVGPGDWAARLELRTTEDDPADSAAVFTQWKRLIIGDYTARGIEFRAVLESNAPGIQPKLSALSMEIDMPDRVVSERDKVVPVSGLSLTYPSGAFQEPPSIAIAAQNLATGDYWTITNQTASGFDIEFFNSADTSIERTFDYVAKGFGRVVT